MGDFNVDLLKTFDKDNASHFYNGLSSYFFTPHILQPTRLGSKTLIDNIFCNILPLPDSEIILSDITDHYPIATNVGITPLSVKTYPLPKRRRATRENLASLGASLNSADWSCVYNSNDVNLSYDNFLNVFNVHLDDHIPRQKDNRVNYKT